MISGLGDCPQPSTMTSQKRRLRKEHVRANEASVFPQVYNTVICALVFCAWLGCLGGARSRGGGAVFAILPKRFELQAGPIPVANEFARSLLCARPERPWTQVQNGFSFRIWKDGAGHQSGFEVFEYRRVCPADSSSRGFWQLIQPRRCAHRQ